jgi:hypothetical protein
MFLIGRRVPRQSSPLPSLDKKREEFQHGYAARTANWVAPQPRTERDFVNAFALWNSAFRAGEQPGISGRVA